MKRVKLDEFLKLPAGTLFVEEDFEDERFESDQETAWCISRPWDVSQIFIKEKSIEPDDWFESRLIDISDQGADGGSAVHAANSQKILSGENVTIDRGITTGRNGIYPDADKIRFIVLDETDHQILIDRLTEALSWRRGIV